MDQSNTNGVNTNNNYHNQSNAQKPSVTAPQPVDLLLGIKNLAECFVGTFEQVKYINNITIAINSISSYYCVLQSISNNLNIYFNFGSRISRQSSTR